ncbi:SAM-dependent methyltransferase [Chelativorans xinjiangense]|uniref:SAM-dependent methyltransferase n=1 Tax=Chelativorans xinjiangense TaxID=2681485 RepID=UPI00135C8E84|nr:class I SAM-dependent methyltransferase [Chelativorans xinjiangense]
MAKPTTGWQAAGRDRFRPVIETMGLSPGDRLLEIGCGNGVSVEMICKACPAANITAIDRSTKMTERAVERNRAHVETGRARILTAPLVGLRLEERFGKIFAVNVNVFWMKPARELEVVRRLLAPRGTLYLFYQPPAGSSVIELQKKLRRNLEAARFSVAGEHEISASAIVTSCTQAKAG